MQTTGAVIDAVLRTFIGHLQGNHLRHTEPANRPYEHWPTLGPASAAIARFAEATEQSDIAPQLARSSPVFALDLINHDVDRTRFNTQGFACGTSDRFYKRALLINRASLEKVNLEGWRSLLLA